MLFCKSYHRSNLLLGLLMTLPASGYKTGQARGTSPVLTRTLGG